MDTIRERAGINEKKNVINLKSDRFSASISHEISFLSLSLTLCFILPPDLSFAFRRLKNKM